MTANALGLNPVLTASANSAGGVLGKMISLQSIAVAVAATGMAASDEGKLFRATLRHSIILAVFMALVALMFAYVFSGADAAVGVGEGLRSGCVAPAGAQTKVGMGSITQDSVTIETRMAT